MKSANEMRNVAIAYIEEMARKEEERVASIVENAVMEKITEKANEGKFYAEFNASSQHEATMIKKYLTNFGYAVEYQCGILMIRW